jgi:hypothetical protein
MNLRAGLDIAVTNNEIPALGSYQRPAIEELEHTSIWAQLRAHLKIKNFSSHERMQIGR